MLLHFACTCSPVDIEAVVPSTPEAASLVVRLPTTVGDCRQEEGRGGGGGGGVEVPVVIEFTSSRPLTLTGHFIFRDRHTGKKSVSPPTYTYTIE